jgi:general secretion pathway protein D
MMMLRRISRSLGFFLVLPLLAGCETLPPLGLTPLGEPGALQAAPPRINSAIPADRNRRAAFEEHGVATAPAIAPPQAARAAGQAGDVTLNFVDTDIREIARTILGTMLKLNFTIDPNVHGTASIETGTPVARSQLLPTLETVLNQNGATLIEKNGLYVVVPTAAAGVTNAVAGANAPGAGTQVVALRYAAAKDLAKLLEPYVGEGGKIAPDAGRNALIISGDAAVRQSLVGLIRAFDIDILAGQSFALFPTGDGDVAKIAAGLEKVLQTGGESPLEGVVRVVPMPRVNAVLVVSSQPRYLEAAKRFFRLTGRVEDATARGWHVYYVQNGQSADLENLLQRAFTPGNVSASNLPGRTAPGTEPVTMGAGSGFGSGALNSAGRGAGAGLTGLGSNPALLGAAGASGGPTGAATPEAPPPAAESLSGDKGAEAENRIRIIANRRNNALLIYATPSEYRVIEGMLRKIDLTPLQVLIEATIAEVTLNDQLAYGTQFFLGGKLAGILTTAGPAQATTVTGTGALTTNAPTTMTVGGIPVTMGSNFPGFVLANGVREVLNALSAVTQVKVLSSPHLMVLDNEPARLQVGQQVPILTGTATSTLSTGAPIVNSIDYHSTGVIMQVTPHINSGGLVTLDIAQEVSDVAAPAANTAIGSPTFDDRIVRTRVAVQDGQTVALAGLIRDNAQEGNSGIPYLKDVPVLGTLFSSQTGKRERTELLVLLTPRVAHDQRDARALTEDLRRELVNAALVGPTLAHKPLRGSSNPNGL